MLPKLQHYLTNWIDGMKINRQHFVDSENALIDHIRDVFASNIKQYNYGLLQPLPGEKRSLECNVISTQSKQIKISVSHCRAVTSGGCRIEILPGIHPELMSDQSLFQDVENDNKGNTKSYFAIITVDPFNRQPYGPASADEYPQRNQFAINRYKLGLINEELIHTGSLGAYHVPIARFVMKHGDLIPDENYIPPCAVVSAHPATRQIYNSVAERLNFIQECSMEITQKVVELTQNNPLAQNLKKICEQSAYLISSETFAYRSQYSQLSPFYIAQSIVKTANAVSFYIKTLSDREKEELLQYFSHWIEISPAKLEEMLLAVINSNYDHENIYEFFQPLLYFIKTWGDLLDKLKGLKLIGEKKGGFDFGGRTVDTPKENKRGGRIGLLD